MKKILVFITLLSLSMPAMAGSIFDSGVEVKEKVVNKVSSISGETRCPVCNDTKIEDVKRAPWDVQVTWDFLDMPKQGKAGFNALQNYNIKLTHNLSRTLFAYASYGVRKWSKTEYAGSEYGTDWTASYVFAGFGVYFTPTLKVYGGMAPYFEAKDEDDNSPTIDSPIEYGIEYDIAWNGNKFVFGLREVMAQQKASDGDDISDSQGDAGFVSISAGFSMPIEW